MPAIFARSDGIQIKGRKYFEIAQDLLLRFLFLLTPPAPAFLRFPRPRPLYSARPITRSRLTILNFCPNAKKPCIAELWFWRADPIPTAPPRSILCACGVCDFGKDCPPNPFQQASFSKPFGYFVLKLYTFTRRIKPSGSRPFFCLCRAGPSAVLLHI